MEKERTITILGSSGSIGVQALDVIRSKFSDYRVGYLTVNSNIRTLEQQSIEFNPVGVAIRNENACREFRKKTNFKGIILCGEEGIRQAAADSGNDLVLSALVGFSGVLPTLDAIEAGTDIALANKETLVSAGGIITESAKNKGVSLIAVDSEHSAVLQCLVGERIEEVEKIILTASGGPFRNTNASEFERLTAADALKHPNWNMGSKITIDSATMMNKGFEIIEAYWLFGIGKEKIDVLIHPQSIVHSLVQFIDGSVKAQLGLPDMRIPISYALSYPRRMYYEFPRLKLEDTLSLTFSKPDYHKFPCLRLAYEALESGGTAPASINAANEIAVYSFLDGKIKFTDIPKIIDFTMSKIENTLNPSIDDIIESDFEARLIAQEYIYNLITN
ncbi:MAG: 1-deoxy-D-xylulose-5-phosphate reductoisomerase [Bacteroidota bacterium]|nr:1-deoxy-D-xylulose-5-phosphate reductoisomerase [Bacteroidota bacterium]